jgi:hypothetical protein
MAPNTLKSGKPSKSKPGSQTTDKPKTFLHGLDPRRTSSCPQIIGRQTPDLIHEN